MPDVAPFRPAPDAEPLPGYRLEAFLGKGGFGEVWRATGPGGFPVALKFLQAEEAAASRELRSLEVLQRVRDAHLLSLHGVSQIAGWYVLAMELADGTLADRLKECKRAGMSGIPREELLRYFQDAAKAIDFLNEPRHSVGDSGDRGSLQHGDIKPQNLMIVGSGCKVGDFGLLRFLTNTQPLNPTTTMSVHYAPPEMFNGSPANTSDQYSLAISWCELSGGRLPFTGNPMQLMTAHAVDTPDLSMIAESDRPAVAMALSKMAAARWQSCQSFVDALRQGDGILPPRKSSGSTPALHPTLIASQNYQTTPFTGSDSRIDEWRNAFKPPSGSGRPPSSPSGSVRPPSSPSGSVRPPSSPSSPSMPSDSKPPTAPPEEPPARRSKSRLGLLLFVLVVGAIAVAAGTPSSPSSVLAIAGGYELQDTIRVDLPGGQRMDFVLIPPGKFTMGSPIQEPKRSGDEELHEVAITEPFYLGKYEVTQEQYESVLQANPSFFSAHGEGKARVKREDTKQYPVEKVSWHDAVTFCKKLTESDTAGRKFRLPTEAEWEFACRADTSTPFHFGVALNGDTANCDSNFPYGTAAKGKKGLARPARVGAYPGNDRGLHDMHGNVWEWCSDYAGPYAGLNARDPVRSEKLSEERRAIRGGSWNDNPRACRSASRSWSDPMKGDYTIGFRVVLYVE